MTPDNIVALALEHGIDVIAITDHNSTRHCRLAEHYSRNRDIFVLCGAEITTKEEAHCLAYMPDHESLDKLQAYLDEHLPDIPNNPDVFGDQVQIDEDFNIIYEEPRLLTSAIDQSVNEIADFVHSIGGLFVPAHIDKTTTSSESLINSSSMTPAITILTFKIDSYQPDKEYYCKVGNKVAAKLSPKGDGTVSVSVNFPAISFGKAQKATGSTFTTVTLYCSGSDKTAASIVVKVNGSKEKSGARFKYQMSYSLEAAVAGTQKAMVTTSGNTTATPVHDAMPIVATPLTITKYMIDHSSPENSLSFNMLGSAVKWKIYGESSKHTVGEVIKSVSFTSNGQAICGTFNYNMNRNDFVISGLSGKTVTSHVDELGMVIGNGLDNYKPVHMILAPGTFSGNIVVTTDKANYYASVKELTYKRAILKSLSVNLDGSNVTRVPFEPEVDPEPEPDPTPSADIDDWTVNNDGYEF